MRKSAKVSEPADEGDVADVESGGIRTIHVAARILSALADYSEPARVTDLARRLGLSMPTISRHLSTWRKIGYVDKPEGQESYRLTMALLGLANAAMKQNNIARIAMPLLVRLRDQIGETVVLSSLSDGKAITQVCLDSGRPTTVVVREGSPLSLPDSPSARLIWSFGASDRDALARTAAAIDYNGCATVDPAALLDKVQSAQKQWYDVEVNLADTYIGAIAAPIFDFADRTVAAVAIIRPSAGLQSEGTAPLIGPLQECAAALSAALGSSGWVARRADEGAP